MLSLPMEQILQAQSGFSLVMTPGGFEGSVVEEAGDSVTRLIRILLHLSAGLPAGWTDGGGMDSSMAVIVGLKEPHLLSQIISYVLK